MSERLSSSASTARPPADITPAAFFGDWLPARADSIAGDPSLSVRVELHGDGGGAWDLRPAVPGLTVAPADGGDVDITMTLSVDDWRALIVGEPGSPRFAPPEARVTDMLFLNPAVRELLTAVSGSIRFDVSGYRGRTWTMLVRFGASSPAAIDTITTTDAGTFAAILAREVTPPQALEAGLLRLEGPHHLAMQLALGLVP